MTRKKRRPPTSPLPGLQLLHHPMKSRPKARPCLKPASLSQMRARLERLHQEELRLMLATPAPVFYSAVTLHLGR